jgi:cAMP-dependent protein kinase regulator
MEVFMASTKKPAVQKMRGSVSAEVYGLNNSKKAFIPKVVAKTEAQKSKIRIKLDESFMFKLLEESEKKIVLNAMEEKKFKAGESVINYGDDGDVLYLVDEGELDCFRIFDGVKKTFLTYKPGMAFGE